MCLELSRVRVRARLGTVSDLHGTRVRVRVRVGVRFRVRVGTVSDLHGTRFSRYWITTAFPYDQYMLGLGSGLGLGLGLGLG